MSKHGGFDYVVAAVELQVTKSDKKLSGRKKKGTRKPDGFVRPSTKLVLIVLANHRNAKTGQCNPSRQTLADETGYTTRTVTFELQALKELSIIDWVRGWGNAHKHLSNRYVLNLAEMVKRRKLLSEVVADEGEVVTKHVNLIYEEGEVDDPLTSKEPLISKTSKTLNLALGSAEPNLFVCQKENSKAGNGEPTQRSLSEPDSHANLGEPDSHAGPFADLNESKLIGLLPYDEGMKLWKKYDQGATYKQHRAEIIAAVLDYQKTQEAIA